MKSGHSPSISVPIGPKIKSLESHDITGTGIKGAPLKFKNFHILPKYNLFTLKQNPLHYSMYLSVIDSNEHKSHLHLQSTPHDSQIELTCPAPEQECNLTLDKFSKNEK